MGAKKMREDFSKAQQLIKEGHSWETFMFGAILTSDPIDLGRLSHDFPKLLHSMLLIMDKQVNQQKGKKGPKRV